MNTCVDISYICIQEEIPCMEKILGKKQMKSSWICTNLQLPNRRRLGRDSRRGASPPPHNNDKCRRRHLHWEQYSGGRTIQSTTNAYKECDAPRWLWYKIAVLWRRRFIASLYNCAAYIFDKVPNYSLHSQGGKFYYINYIYLVPVSN